MLYRCHETMTTYGACFFHAATVVIEQNTGKSHLVKPEPLPISKMENDCINDLARLESFLDRWNYFFKEGQWC